MTPKIKNIIIFVTIAVVFILIYIFFIKPSPEQPSLVSTSSNTILPNIDGTTPTADTPNSMFVTQDFLSLLLSVQQIKIDDAIFSDPAYQSLHDSSITLIPDNTEGRPNPFAPFGHDAVTVVPPTCIPPQILNSVTNTCVNPVTN